MAQTGLAEHIIPLGDLLTDVADTAAAVVQIGARTNDPARDISDEARARVLSMAGAAGLPTEMVAPLTDVIPPRPLDFAQAFGEALPEGLRLRTTDDGNTESVR